MADPRCTESPEILIFKFFFISMDKNSEGNKKMINPYYLIAVKRLEVHIRCKEPLKRTETTSDTIQLEYHKQCPQDYPLDGNVVYTKRVSPLVTDHVLTRSSAYRNQKLCKITLPEGRVAR